MSANEFFKKSVLDIDSFPDDILSEIFRHATWVPYGIGPSDMVEKRLQSSDSRDLTRKYRASLVTRRYLVRVCKKWHRLAFWYLHEWVLVSRLKNLRGTIEILEQQREGYSGTNIGWSTKRLDIDFRWTGEETAAEMNQEGPLLLRLLRAVPNLLVLTAGACHDTTWITSSSSPIYCPKLKFFNLATGEDRIFEPETCMRFVESHPNLIGINIPTKGFPLITQTPPSHALKELTSGILCPGISVDSVFTSLRRLNINLLRMYERRFHPQWCHRLISQPLPSVTSLQLSFTLGTDDHFRNIGPLFKFLPNLHRVDIVLLSWPRTLFGCFFPSSVSILGLRVCSKKPQKKAVKWLLHALNQEVRHASSPLKVQFLDARTMQGVCLHEEYVVRNSEAGEVLQSWLDPDGNIYNLRI